MAEEAPTIESQVQTAMRSRVSYFKEQSDSLTFEGVRRLLEKDLGLEKCALDVHKRVIKQLLLECIGGADDDNAPKNSGESESVGKPREETAESEHQLKKDVEDEKMEDSPVLGLMTGSKTSKNEKKETESIASEVPSENTIKKAVRARASYVRENSDKVTMAGLRRLLEKDLGLDEHTLDPYKKLISAQLDEALNSSEGSESPTEVEKKKVKKGSQIKSSEKGSSDENSDASGSESEEVEEEEEEEEEEKPRKKIIRKEKLQKSEPKKRKRPVKEAKVSSTKQVKLAKRMSVKKSAAEDSEHEDDNSQSSAENPVKKKEVPTPAYGKRVEHLKSVIKSCGMGVPPVTYKKVKQVSENKREAALIKELEEILSKEGLSANPSEKQIKEVRRRKERARELEGIDTSNIVSSSRRRSTTSFTAPPPKPKIPVESDHSGSSDSDDEDSDDGEDEDNEDEGDEENGESQSEEVDDDNDEDSD